MTDTAAKRIERLREQIRRHDHAYYVLDQPTISDRQYDELFAELKEIRGRAALDPGDARGELREGMIAGIKSAGEVLAEHFPWAEGDRNELPDRVIVRRS